MEIELYGRYMYRGADGDTETTAMGQRLRPRQQQQLLEYKQQDTTSNTLNILWISGAHQARRPLV